MTQYAIHDYPVRLDVDYVERHSRLTSFFRLILAAPIVAMAALLVSGSSFAWMTREIGGPVGAWGWLLGIGGSLFVPTAFMIAVRQRYPQWWFEFARELQRFTARIWCYVLLLTDEYPSTVDEQRVRLEFDYPNVERDLNRWLPLIKWGLAIPHHIVLTALSIGVVVVIPVAWIAIVITGRYPRGLFDYVVGVGRWYFRVWGYAFLLITDRYPPFRLAR